MLVRTTHCVDPPKFAKAHVRRRHRQPGHGQRGQAGGPPCSAKAPAAAARRQEEAGRDLVGRGGRQCRRVHQPQVRIVRSSLVM